MKKFSKLLSLLLLLFLLTGWIWPDISIFRTECSKLPEKKLLQLAQEVLLKHLRHQSMSVSSLKFPAIRTAQGVFVTLIKNGKPRGCMGVLEPVGNNLIWQLSKATVLAATADVRFKPVCLSEFSEIKYCVSIIGPLTPVSSLNQLNPQKYGLLVKKGEKSAVLLPGEARTVIYQLQECKRKAGISQSKDVQMYIFPTVTFGP